MIDIAAAVVISLGVFSALTGKAAARKRRFWPAWCLYGAILGPFALLHILLAPPLEPCPSCGRNIRIKPSRPCKHCAWTLPPPLKNARVASDLRETFGFRLGDTAAHVEKSLTQAGAPFERTSETNILCAARETFGYPADVTVELDEGRANCIRVSYPVDRDYKIYYDLKAALVSKYGKPDYENFDVGYTDNWAAKKFLVSLSTTPPTEEGATPSTAVIYQKLGGKLEKNLTDALVK
ncbi:hypothetical protein LJC31_00630 [Synergistaceae bacterium OttesenSCG-928-I11]|nr:hypothetical protein [Synergistaceae bacterium OttesenSCG-928-I11]